MSLQDIAKKMADNFQAEILRFADQKKTRRVYVAKWTYSNNFRISFYYDRFYDFFATLGKPAFLSEYDAPFDAVATFDKAQNMAASVGSTGKKESLEKLYFNGTLDEYKKLMGAEYRPMGEKQLDLFADSA